MESDSFVPALYKPSALLPIARHKESIVYTVETFPVVVIIGQTGSGKTTQLPQFLNHAGWCNDGKSIAITQVGYRRRLAEPPRLMTTTAPACRSDYSGC